MARLSTTFDATQHNTEQADYSELPNGIYDLEIIASDVTPTKDGRGTILKTTNAVVRPEEFAGRKLFNNYNLENANPQAQEIGQRQFASLCRAIGKPSIEDSEELHGYPYRVKIALGKPSKDGQYPARAEIKRYFFEDEGDMPEPGIDADQPAAAPRAAANDNRAAARPAAPAAAAAGNRPWGNKR